MPHMLLQRRVVDQLPVDREPPLRGQRLYSKRPDTKPRDARVAWGQVLSFLHRQEHLRGANRDKEGMLSNIPYHASVFSASQ